MLGDFRGRRAAKGSKKIRGERQAGGSGRPAPQRSRTAVFELLELRQMLTGTVVTVSDVSDDGTAASLRNAVATAATTTGQSTYTINLTSTDGSGGAYTLGNNGGELSIPAFTNPNMTLIIEGQGSTGPGATTIKQTATDRVFQIAAGDTVIFENLEITGGTAETDSSGGTSEADGGGILNQGNLTLNNVAVIGNMAKATMPSDTAFGGGIFSTGALSITGRTPGASLIEQNSALGSTGADGLNHGDGGNGEGGGVFTSTVAQVQITGTTIANNTATGGIGPTAIASDNYVVNGVTVPGDVGGQGIGGGVFTTYITAAPTTILDNDTIANNQAVGGNGGTGGNGQNGGSGGYGIGGGAVVELSAYGQSVTSVPAKISDSTISGNTATGGIGGPVGSGGTSAGASDGAFGGGIQNAVAGTEVVNDTISNNTANGLNGFSGGGGIADDSLGMLIASTTIAWNTAQASTGTTTYGGGLLQVGSDGQESGYDPDLQLANTLIADNTAVVGTDFCGAAYQAVGVLINNASGCNITNGSGNITAPSALGLAAALANNGGTTQTLALLAGSAAIGAGDVTSANNLGLTTDQRGLPRINTSTNPNTIDIGAYEVQAGPVTTSIALSQSAASVNVGQNVTFTAVVSPTAGVTAAPTGSVQFMVDGVAFGSPVALGVVNGVDQAVLSTSSLAAGTHTITAVYTDTTDSNFATSTSTALNEKIINLSATGTSTAVSALPNPVAQGANIIFTATVTPGSGLNAPTGNVQFEVDGVVVGTSTLNGLQGLDQATFNTSSLAAGAHTLTAVYSGDSNFNGSISPTINPVTVTAPFGAPSVAGPTATTENTAVSGLVITPAAGDSTVTYFQITGITGGTLYYSGGSAQITSGQFITVASGAAGLEFIPATNSVSSGGFTVQESTTNNSGGLVGTTTAASISITGTRTVDLSSYYNVAGITTDGATFGPGLDGQGNALSATGVGTSVVWNQITFAIGSPDVNDVVQGLGQTIALPAGNYSNVTLLALATNGNQASQQFIIHYSDGTSTTVSQSISDWAMPQGYAGESVAVTTAYRNTSTGGRNNSTFDVYGYSFAVDPTKTVQSITLPNNAKVKVLSIATQATLNAPTGLTATLAGSGSVNLTWTASTSTVTGYDVYRYTLGNANAPTLLAAVTTTNYTNINGVAGNTYYYVVKAVNGAAISPASNVASATLTNTSPATEVDLTGMYNLVGITADGAPISGGLDGQGAALSATQVYGFSSTSVASPGLPFALTTPAWSNVNFAIAPTGANNVIQATGQTIMLPSGSYSAIDLLATAVNGNQLRQWFTVNYTDGSSNTFVQSLSDWYSPQGYSGESVAVQMAYRNTSGGGRDNRPFNVYGYSLLVDPTKTVASITLPFNSNVDVLAIDTVATVTAPTGLAVAATSSTQAQLSWTAAAGTVTGYNVYRGTSAGGESSTPINATPLSVGTTSYTDATAAPGNTYFYVVKAVNGPALSAASNEVSATMPTTGSNIQVDLAGQYNVAGITVDGTSFSGGLDGKGNALSESQVGTSLNWSNVNFNIAPAGGANVISAVGQTIGLPNGSYSAVELLATAVNGSQVNQSFTVKYTDNTSANFNVSLSDWAAPQGFAGESDALNTFYRNTSKGGRNGGTFEVYGYSLPVDPTKTVESITLPSNPNVEVLAISAAGVTAAAPLLTASSNGPSIFTFGGPAVPVDSLLAIASNDTNLTSATVTISADTRQTGDTLNFNNQNGISGSYSGGVLTLTGSSSVANYEAALQSVTFSSTSTDTTPRALSIVANDNLLSSNTAAETVNIAPVVIPSGTTNTFTIGGSAVAVDSGVTVNSNDANLTSATVTISAGTLQTGDTLNFNNQNGISGSYSGGVLTLSGSATPAEYSAALQSVTFSSTSTDTTPRSLSIVANDNLVPSNSASETVNIAPVVIPSGTTNTFTVGGSAVAVDSGVTVNSNDANLTSATLTISAGTLQTGDTLNFSNQNGISGSYSGGVLTLTGTASVANYEAALQSVTFSSTSTDTTPRSLSIVANDNLLSSNTASETVNIAPVVIPSGTTNTFTIGGSAVAVDSGVTVNSNDANLTSATLTISAGTLQTGDLLIFNNQNSITGNYSGGVLTLTGADTVANYVAALQSVTFSTSSGTLTPRSLTLDVEDTNSVESNVAPETVDVTT